VGLISGRGFLYLDINPSEKAESQLHLMIACRYDQRVQERADVQPRTTHRMGCRRQTGMATPSLTGMRFSKSLAI
jgi:hypothetical protein